MPAHFESIGVLSDSLLSACRKRRNIRKIPGRIYRKRGGCLPDDTLKNSWDKVLPELDILKATPELKEVAFALLPKLGCCLWRGIKKSADIPACSALQYFQQAQTRVRLFYFCYIFIQMPSAPQAGSIPSPRRAGRCSGGPQLHAQDRKYEGISWSSVNRKV